jgi:hypothetical protein
MSATTFEEAKCCPKCKEPGEDRKTESVPNKPGVTLHWIYCATARCKWFDTPWAVQVNKDGSIPPETNHTGKPKIYQGFEGHDQMANQILIAAENDRLASLEKHSEIKRRR